MKIYLVLFQNFLRLRMAVFLLFAYGQVSYGQTLWSSAGGVAWLTGTNWTGSAVPNNTGYAQFGTNPTSAATGIGINMNSNSGNQAVGAIEVISARSNALIIGNNSITSGGTLTLNGTIVNSINDVILRHNGTALWTIQNTQGSGNQTMSITLGNTTNNIINIDNTGGITISSIITGTGRNLTKGGSGSGILQLTEANAYSGTTTINAGTLQLNRTGGTTIPATNNVTVSGGTLRISSDQTLNNLSYTSGTITVDSGVTLTINGVLDCGTNTISGAGNFTLASGATLRTAHTSGLNCIGVSGTKTFNTGSNYEFNGTAEQIPNFVQTTVNNLTVNNSAGIKLSESITISGMLTLTTGDLDLNNFNITLNGTMSEDRANNHIVKDNTATTDANQGGIIIFTSTVNTGTAELKGTGLYLKTTSGAYNVTVNRKHYRGGGKGIKRIYQITPDVPANVISSATEMRIYYASDELAGVGAPFILYRWTSATGWEIGSASIAFDDGTNGTSPNYVQGINVSAFSHWTVGSINVPLPITLLSFAGKRNERMGEYTAEVKLEWATVSETNNKGFEVEMSEDGFIFKKVAFVEGKGNSFSVINYEFRVHQTNDAYYRLKQIDFDGTFSYSRMVFVEGIKSMTGDVLVYPNPNNGTFTVLVGKNELDSPACLFNAVGKEVWCGTQTEIRITNLPEGIYFLHTAVAGKTKITKVVIKD